MATLAARSRSVSSTTLLSASRSLSTTAATSGVTVAIRREDPSRIWERRCPLTPDHVAELTSRGHTVIVQDCDRRIWSSDDFEKAGAQSLQTPQFQAANAHIIIGIKETPLREVLTSAVPSPSLSSRNGARENTKLEDWTRRTHVMFSHTAKGQPYNTPLLAKFLPNETLNYHLNNANSTTPGIPKNKEEWIKSLAPRLIDYELLTEEVGGKRSVAFGWFAGVAGVLESLSSMAHSHLEIGIASPFLYTPRPHTHPSLEALRRSLRDVGRMVLTRGTPPSLGPFVIGLTGNGNVSQGCLSMLQELPLQYVQAKDLDKLVKDPETSLKKIYLVHASPKDYLTRLDGGAYDREHYYASPQSYRSDFADKIAPYLTLFLNGTGWQPSFPRLMTDDQLEVALYKAKSIGGARFTNIGDISCDLEGGLEFMKRSSTISSPFYKIQTNSPDLPSVQIMSVDILPAAIPLDASNHFSAKFFGYLEALVDEYQHPHPHQQRRHNEKMELYKQALKRATIAERGELVDTHRWLREGVEKWRGENPGEGRKLMKDVEGLVNPSSFSSSSSSSAATTTFTPHPAPSGVNVGDDTVVVSSVRKVKKKMLMLGSGMVAGPAVDEIAKRGDIELLIASNSLREVEGLTKDHLNVKYRLVDMSDLKTVDELIQQADVVISLLPAMLHPKAAELCIQHKKHMVTASYISPEMHALHERALSSDVLLLNEIGLDPGIDHCSAIDLIERLKSSNKKIKSFISFCGGLPAPDVPHVPFRYKFSWSPRGVLAAALNSARYKLNGQVWNIPGKNILKSYFPDIPITSEFDLEGIANRDSLPYLETYNLGPVDDLRTVLRGTLRYPGFSQLMDSFKSLGLLETQNRIHIGRWSEFIPQALCSQLSVKPGTLNTSAAIKTLVPQAHASAVHDALHWLSLMPSHNANTMTSSSLPPVPKEAMAPIDLLSILLAHKLRYHPGERDMVIMSHEIIAVGRTPGAEEEVHTSSLTVYGNDNASAMALTVGLPVAFAALRVIDGKVPLRGVAGPGDKSVYRHILAELDRVGLGMKESSRVISASGGKTIEKALLPVSF